MSKAAKCLIVDDQLAGTYGSLEDTLKTFSELEFDDDSKIFQLLLLSDEQTVKQADERLNSFVRVEPYRSSHEDLPSYLASTLTPHDLAVIDVRLNKHFDDIDYGPTALLKALRERLDKRQLDEFREELRVVFITQYPKEVIRFFDSVQALIKELKHPVSVIEKASDLHLKLRDAIDSWRVSNDLIGRKPGPQLLDYLNANREIHVNFQPIVNLITCQIYSYEVLARDAKEGGAFPQTAFDDAYGLGKGWPEKINMLVFEEFLKWATEADDAYRSFHYSLNASPSTLTSEVFQQRFFDRGSINALPLHCRNIGFELLEKEISRAKEGDLLRAREHMGRLGYRFEIDDYGMGSAAADRLRWFKPDAVKLDRQFVGEFCKERDPTGTGRSLSEWAKGNNVKLVAEGVDSSFDARELHRLIDAGFTLAQGYLFGGASSVPARDVLAEGARIINEVDILDETQDLEDYL